MGRLGGPWRAATKVLSRGPFFMVGNNPDIPFRRARSTLPSKPNRSVAYSYPSPRRSHGVLNEVELFHDSLWRFSPWVLLFPRTSADLPPCATGWEGPRTGRADYAAEEHAEIHNGTVDVCRSEDAVESGSVPMLLSVAMETLRCLIPSMPLNSIFSKRTT